MGERLPSWDERLARLRARADELLAANRGYAPLRGETGPSALARLREAARPLLAAVADAYRALCPDGYPTLEDNGIPGPGGSIGLRFSRWHAVFFALEHAPRRKPEAPQPAGLAGALGIQRKRLPGEPLPPPDPNVPLELVVLMLRWDEGRGWVEVRRPLHPAWSADTLQEHLTAYLLGFNHDVALGLLAEAGPV